MSTLIKPVIATLLAMAVLVANAQPKNLYSAIHSGVPWFDNNGNVISAHGGCIIKDKALYYLFGERHTDTSNVFAGFNCYSSADLYNWKFESVALPLQGSGKLGPNRVGERVKVMKCPATGLYVMYMHVDTLGYVDQYVGYATSTNIAGPYTFKGPLLFEGNPIRKWDMGVFQDEDGEGYILLHGGDIYQLNADYQSVHNHLNIAMVAGFESPAMFKKDGLYYFLGSDLTSWERNDNYYFIASSLKGPWIPKGHFAPPGTLTWNSQTTFVLPISGSAETTYMFMGDRWSFPRQASAATYVWQPLNVYEGVLSIPQYQEAWKIDLATGKVSTTTVGKKVIRNNDKKNIHYAGNWQQVGKDTLSVSSSGKKDVTFSLCFSGTQIGIYGLARPDGGYANVAVRDKSGRLILSSIIDMYCKYQVSTLKFLSPELPRDRYSVTVSGMQERGNWSDKKKNIYGSTGYYISVEKIVFSD